MTLDIAQAGRYVFYLNFRTEVGLETGTVVFAEAEQVFNFSNLIEDSSKYVVSVERFRVPTQAIPMLPAINAAIQIVQKDGGGVPTVFDLLPTFSLHEFLVQVNSITGSLVFSLTEDGRMAVFFNVWDGFNIEFNPKIAAIFDMTTTIGQTVGGTATVVGASPIFDRFDDLHKLQIEAQTGLSGIQQEIITTQVFRNLLTDFLMPSSTTMSYTGQMNTQHNPAYTVGFNVREDVEFNDSSNRRFIMLKGNAPIQNIKLEITAVFRDGTRNRIILPPNSIMEIKLAFWKKHA